MKNKLYVPVFLITLLLLNITISFAQTPDWVWAKKAQCISQSSANRMAMDASGNCYVTGYFNSSPITFDTITLTNAGGSDVFIVKYDAGGNVIWAKQAGGSDFDMGFGIAIDAQGNSLVTGYFISSTISFGNTTLYNNPPYPEIFIVKYDSSGSVLWAKKAGGSDTDIGYQMTVDGNGNSYLTGYFSSPNITFDTVTLTNNSVGFTDAFIVKFDPSGNVIWAKSAGGSFSDAGMEITVDVSGNVYLAGSFSGFSIQFDSLTLNNAGPILKSDLFVVKFNSSGHAIWAKRAGGSLDEFAYGIEVDLFGNVFLCGSFTSTYSAFGNVLLYNSVGNQNEIFIAKYDSSGNFLWAKKAGGTGNDYVTDLGLDTHGNCYITGFYHSPIIGFGNNTLTNSGVNQSSDIFIAKLDSSGNHIWALSEGGTDTDESRGISIDNGDNLYVAGGFRSPSISFGNTVLTHISPSYLDFFYCQIG